MFVKRAILVNIYVYFLIWWSKYRPGNTSQPTALWERFSSGSCHFIKYKNPDMCRARDVKQSTGALSDQHNRRTFCKSSTRSPNLNVSYLLLQLSLSNPLKPGVKSLKTSAAQKTSGTCFSTLDAGINLVRPANESRRYNITTSLIGWTHT